MIPMRHKKRLSRTPHPRSVFSRSARTGATSLTRSKHRARAAFVRVGTQTVIVIEVKASLITDAFEAQLALSAVELTCAMPAVLWAYEPCGCRDLVGRREHVTVIDAMPDDAFAWEPIVLDFGAPAAEKWPTRPTPTN